MTNSNLKKESIVAGKKPTGKGKNPFPPKKGKTADKASGKKEKTCPDCGKPMSKCKCAGY
jgi:hypothetical protein